jgi:NADH-quinone oxidoreductase subunit C
MSSEKNKVLLEAINEILGTETQQIVEKYGELTLEINKDKIVSVMRVLKEADQFLFTQLTDISVVDYLTYGQADWQTQKASSQGFSRAVTQSETVDASASERRFAVVYQLLSVTYNVRLRVKVYLESDLPRLSTVSEIWPVADWYERESFDLFGILFEDHPDLRRLLTDYGFIGHPFRKDFPLEGYVEVRYDPEKGRVVNEPVSIEPRTLVPRVIRQDDWVHSSKPLSEQTDA